MNMLHSKEKNFSQHLCFLTLILMLVMEFSTTALDNGILNTDFSNTFLSKAPFLLGQATGHVLGTLVIAAVVVGIDASFKILRKQDYPAAKGYQLFSNTAWILIVLMAFRTSVLAILITLIGGIIYLIVQAIVKNANWFKTILTIILAIIIAFFGLVHQSVEQEKKDDQATMETITGTNQAYSIDIPSNWKIERNTKEDFDILAHNKSLYVEVIAEETDLENAKAIADLAQQRLKENATDLTISENQSFELDGRHWLQFTAKARVDNIPVSYLFYVYSGYEGTYQLIGFTSQNLFDRDKSKIHKILQTFHLAKPAKPSNKPDLPVRLSPKEALEKFDLGRDYYNNEQYAEAYRVWTIAADAKVLEAYNNLAYLAYNGLGVTENPVEAIRRWKIAAVNGEVESQIHLAEAYQAGSAALKKDPVMAYVWASIAKHFAPRVHGIAQNYSQDAENIIKDCKSKLSQEEIKRADEKAFPLITEVSTALKSSDYIRRWPLKP